MDPGLFLKSLGQSLQHLGDLESARVWLTLPSETSSPHEQSRSLSVLIEVGLGPEAADIAHYLPRWRNGQVPWSPRCVRGGVGSNPALSTAFLAGPKVSGTHLVNLTRARVGPHVIRT